MARARGELEQEYFLNRTIDIQQQIKALQQSKLKIASDEYHPQRPDMAAIEAALCETAEMADCIVSAEFIDLFVSHITPLTDTRCVRVLDFSPKPTAAFLNLAGQRKYTTCTMESKLQFDPLIDKEGHPSLFRAACVRKLPA